MQQLQSGRHFLQIPGPTNVPDRILRAIERPTIDHRGPEFKGLCFEVLEGIKEIFQTREPVIIYPASGTGAWEAALVNTHSSGERVLMYDTGHFASTWHKLATKLGLDAQLLPGSWREGVRPDEIEQALSEDNDRNIKSVCVVHNDTATGITSDIPAIRKAIDKSGHNALFCVDTISSLGSIEYKHDEWSVDVTVGGSQKGLMLPPGLSFVAAGERAWAAHPTAGLRTRYWDWSARHGELHPEKYCGTPPEHLLYGLRCSLDMLLREGLDNVIERHRLLANAVRTAVTTWSEGGALEFNILEPRQRADSVTTVLMDEAYDPVGFRDFCKARCGVIVGGGIGDLRGKALRIAHMGHINAPHILGALGVVELGLIARNVPHGAGGVQKAIEFLGENLKA